MEDIILEGKQIVKNFNLKKEVFWEKQKVLQAVGGINIQLRRGQTIGIVGESGSGKSTLGEVLGGLQQPTSGTVLYHGKDLAQMNREERRQYRRNIQFIFQNPKESMNPYFTIEKILTEPLKLLDESYTPSYARQKIAEILPQVGMEPDCVKKYPSELSGGQCQRIAIARALLLSPEIIVCDECVSALDVSVQAQILNLLKSLQRRYGTSYLFISHDIHVVRRISDRSGVMYGGRIVEKGETKKICSDPWHPYTKQLIEAVPEPDPLRAAKIKAAPLKDSTGDGKGIEQSGCPFAGRCGYALECCGKEIPESYLFEGREVSCFLYSDRHSGRRSSDYKMTSQI